MSAVYTLTLNPALDYVVRAERFEPGKINRTTGESISPGGKGINVSLVLREFGVESCALGFAAGFTGEEILREVASRGVACDFVRVAGTSRINVKVRAGEETDINAGGPSVSEEDVAALEAKVRALPAGSLLVLAGSVPASLSKEVYGRLTEAAGEGVRVVVDAQGDALRSAVARGVWLVKPNIEELGELFGVRVEERAQVDACAAELRRMGAQNVLVSMGVRGALLYAEDGQVHFVAAPAGAGIDSVGAGDSLLAGFLAAKLSGESDREALRRGVAAGTATAFRLGLMRRADYEKMLPSVE